MQYRTNTRTVLVLMIQIQCGSTLFFSKGPKKKLFKTNWWWSYLITQSRKSRIVLIKESCTVMITKCWCSQGLNNSIRQWITSTWTSHPASKAEVVFRCFQATSSCFKSLLPVLIRILMVSKSNLIWKLHLKEGQLPQMPVRSIQMAKIYL